MRCGRFCWYRGRRPEPARPIAVPEQRNLCPGERLADVFKRPRPFVLYRVEADVLQALRPPTRLVNEDEPWVGGEGQQ